MNVCEQAQLPIPVRTTSSPSLRGRTHTFTPGERTRHCDTGNDDEQGHTKEKTHLYYNQLRLYAHNYLHRDIGGP